jgi:hypothetical protein
VLLRSIIVERDPIYRQQETVQALASGMFGIGAEEMEHLGDDRLGRALDCWAVGKIRAKSVIAWACAIRGLGLRGDRARGPPLSEPYATRNLKRFGDYPTEAGTGPAAEGVACVTR